MNLLISRILTYLNGTLLYDSHYRFCKFIVYHYLELEDLSFKPKLVKKVKSVKRIF